MDKTAESLPMGAALLGWLSIVFAGPSLGWYPMGGMVLSVVFFSGIGFMMVALTCWKKGFDFGLFAFGIIGVFCWAFVSMMLLPALGLSSAPVPNEIATFMISFSLIVFCWAAITMIMPCRLLSLVIGMAAVMFMMVGLNFLMDGQPLHDVIGWLSLIVGALSVYLGVAGITNHMLKKEMLPMLMCKK